MKKLSIIAVIGKNNELGKDNRLLWNLPDDMKRFKQTTTGHWVIMGKKTYESLPKRPLPNRVNLVISDIEDELIPGCEMAYSIKDAMSKCPEDEECFVIGGGSVYRQMLPFCQRLNLTIVDENTEADTFFPEIDFNEWKVIERAEHSANEKDPHNYVFLLLERIQ